MYKLDHVELIKLTQIKLQISNIVTYTFIVMISTTTHIAHASTSTALRALLDMSRIHHKTSIMSEPNLKAAHVYCKLHRLSGQMTGPLIEHYMIERSGWTKLKSSQAKGDAAFPDGKNIEIKVSLGGERTHRDFNYVQLRPHQPIDIYVLTAYYLDYDNVDRLGDLYVFHVGHDAMKTLLQHHGSYAHGTIEKHGAITRADLDCPTNMKEYALRPRYGDACWQQLLAFQHHDPDPTTNPPECENTNTITELSDQLAFDTCCEQLLALQDADDRP